MGFKDCSDMTAVKKEKYDKMLKDPKIKQLEYIYKLFTEVHYDMLPTMLVWGSNFFGKDGNLQQEIVDSKDLFKLTYNCFQTKEFYCKIMLKFNEAGLKNPDKIKKSILGFSYIPGVTTRTFQSFRNSCLTISTSKNR